MNRNGALLLLICVLLSNCIAPKKGDSSAEFSQTFWIDITQADSIDLACFEHIDSVHLATRAFERKLAHSNQGIDYRKHLRVLFRYRDPLLMPIFMAMCDDTSLALIHRVQAIQVLGEIGDCAAAAFLRRFCRSPNDVVREYAVNAVGKCGDLQSVELLNELRKTESSGYVKATIAAAVSRLCGDSPAPLMKPFLSDTAGLTKCAFLFNPYLIGNDATATEVRLDGSIIQKANKKALIYPHQQYKANPATFYNRYTFGLQPDGGDAIHVGEDSGYFMAGLPVHAIGPGVVTNIVYEDSWGFWVAIQHHLQQSGTVTSFYGHLSRYIDVEVGQVAATGAKIGEIGPQESVENGGYKAHVHWGIARSGYTSAVFAGYANDRALWHNPIALLEGRTIPADSTLPNSSLLNASKNREA